jgi:hypothetical protein
MNVEFCGWLGLILSEGPRNALKRAWFAASQITRQERGAGAERSPDTPGQDERPCEKQTKTGPTNIRYSISYKHVKIF